MRVLLPCTLAVVLALTGMQKAEADPINPIFPSQLRVSDLIDFNDLPLGNHDEVISLFGASFAERFAGQTLSVSGDFDALSGRPTGPLTLLAGAPFRNLDVSNNPFGPPGNRVLDGLGPLGFPSFSAIGEGSVAVLFDIDQSQFGFDILQTNGGSAVLSFFQRDGSLIETLTLSDLTDGPRAFQREGGIADIAGFSIYNNDPGGLAYDNLRLDTIPEPATFILFGTGGFGLLACGYLRRKWAIWS
jgi:PEP-CTERM motif